MENSFTNLALVPTNKEAGRAIVLISKSFFILKSDQRDEK